MKFQSKDAIIYLLFNGEGAAYCNFGGEIADGATFIMVMNSDRCSNKYLEEVYFKKKYEILLEKCSLYDRYDNLEIFLDGMEEQSFYNNLETPSVEKGILICHNDENIELNVDGYCLKLTSVTEASGIYNPWITVIEFNPSEEYGVSYVFKGNDCEIHIIVTSNREHYVKVLEWNKDVSGCGEGDIYIEKGDSTIYK